MSFPSILGYPDFVTLETEQTALDTREILRCGQEKVTAQDVSVSFRIDAEQLTVSASAQTTALKTIRLRWNRPMPQAARYLGDAWERSYGDLEWRCLVATRAMPWYFLASTQTETAGYGVKVRPNALCYWQVDENGITLFLDVRNGGRGVRLNGRGLQVCEVVHQVYHHQMAFEAAHAFCKRMCTDPILPAEPVYGSNNWYYAYGMSSEEEILTDTDYLCNMVDSQTETRPFMVIDDGWQVAHVMNTCNGGPWHKGNEKFPDMARLAQKIKDKNCKPGIWVRLLLTTDESLPETWRLQTNRNVLDPSVPEVLAYIKDAIARIAGWGYQLIKHDFSTYDIFGRWGFEMNPDMADAGWGFADPEKTSAEIIKDLYRVILEAAGPACYILGCNCVGHLGAGLMHLQRVGDDTSGIHWERTRNIGVNTLAFRLPQHKAFFDIDADCVGIMGTIPWKFNRQWSDLVGRSGTSMFVSAKPGLMAAEELEDIRRAFRWNSRQADVAMPLDWEHTTCPSVWDINGETVSYDWYEAPGLLSFGFDIK